MAAKDPKAPSPKADIDEHKKYAEEFLARDEHRDPAKVNKPDYRPENDDAKE